MRDYKMMVHDHMLLVQWGGDGDGPYEDMCLVTVCDTSRFPRTSAAERVDWGGSVSLDPENLAEYIEVLQRALVAGRAAQAAKAAKATAKGDTK